MKYILTVIFLFISVSLYSQNCLECEFRREIENIEIIPFVNQYQYIRLTEQMNENINLHILHKLLYYFYIKEKKKHLEYPYLLNILGERYSIEKEKMTIFNPGTLWKALVTNEFFGIAWFSTFISKLFPPITSAYVISSDIQYSTIQIDNENYYQYSVINKVNTGIVITQPIFVLKFYF